MHDIWEFLKGDSGRPVLALAAILVSTTVAITIFILNRKKKSLVYQFLSMTRLLSVNEEMAGRVRILVDDLQVQDVGLVQIKVTNAGTESIKASDYLRPISFAVDEGVRIIEAEISEQEPITIDAKIQTEDRKATLTPTLLNSKDSLVIKLLIANFNGAISSDARIEGVELKPISRLADSRFAPILSAALKVAPATVGFAAFELAVKATDLHNDYKRPK